MFGKCVLLLLVGSVIAATAYYFGSHSGQAHQSKETEKASGIPVKKAEFESTPNKSVEKAIPKVDPKAQPNKPVKNVENSTPKNDTRTDPPTISKQITEKPLDTFEIPTQFIQAIERLFSDQEEHFALGEQLHKKNLESFQLITDRHEIESDLAIVDLGIQAGRKTLIRIRKETGETRREHRKDSRRDCDQKEIP